ncbi:PDR/VanB family oxidoreductase [Amycolatopsis rhabdoformis]|uniref:PDR/VanB family oxidoreductase n=1 Tax=Amycolatopsis rhabdoformis TaxID=1448059 RepID=A0ABZ1IEB3_9PSEU|nr:PDR/VanB family oxidoreductase [Amycolatopsis rhabdoformis]WSE32424.1 PDR/VanB family oxidoreductase [Amycolatopsis rhabdoformis]
MTQTDPARPEVELDLVVLSRTEIAQEVVELVLASRPGEELPEWEAGSHVDLLLADGLVRQYSLCGRPARDQWRVAVLRERAGRGGSAHVHDRLTEGATVRVRGPRNNFPLLPSPRYLFIAGGIGITPILPMVAAAEATGAQWQLLYGGRSRASMAYGAELASRYGDRVVLCPEDETGRPDLDAWLGTPADDVLVYCCGPESLLLAVEQRCAKWKAGSLRLERFVPKAQPDSPEHSSFEVELARSGDVVTVAPGETILRAVERAGARPPYSCEQGTCGTCETKVLSGTPDHRDSLLTDEEREEGKTMMICVSRAACPRLVLDL